MVTTNSATLVNKGLEVIEAHLLFGVAFDRIDVVVHPQSVVHSMVEFVDGSTIAQCSPPDMRLPIALALGWPDRVPQAAPGLRLDHRHHLAVPAAGRRGVPGGAAGPRVGAAGATYPAVYNAANEECVAGLPRGPAAVHRDRRHGGRGSWTTTTPPSGALTLDGGARRRALGPGPRAPCDPGGVTVPRVPSLGVLVVRRRRRGVHRAARDRPPRARQAVRGQGHPVHGRLRPDPVVPPARRDRVRREGDPARRLHPDDRDVPAQARGGPALGPGRRPPAGWACWSTRPSRRAQPPRGLADQARQQSMEEIPPGDEDRVFYRLSVPRKVVVMMGGPIDEPASSPPCCSPIIVTGFGDRTARRPGCRHGQPVRPAGVRAGDRSSARRPTQVRRPRPGRAPARATGSSASTGSRSRSLGPGA